MKGIQKYLASVKAVDADEDKDIENQLHNVNVNVDLEQMPEYLMNHAPELMDEVPYVEDYVSSETNNVTRKLVNEGFSKEDAEQICFCNLMYMYLFQLLC